ncbi:MAG: phosphatidate cytidylyltransferase [Promethearchaeota archaeon]
MVLYLTISSIPIVVLFCIYGAFHLRHALQIRETEDQGVLKFINESTFFNELLTSCLFFASGTLWPFIYSLTGATRQGVDFLYNLSTVLLLLISSLWYLQALYNYFRCKKNEKMMKERKDEERKMCDYYYNEFELTIGVDMKRKALHLLPGLVVIVIQIMSFWVQPSGIYSTFQVDRESFAIFGEVLIAFAFVFMLGFADLLRLNYFHQLPNWAKKWFFSSITKVEVKSFISSCPLVLTLTPFLFVPFPIFISVAFVSSLSDAAANLIGRKFGKHKFPRGSKKSVEGYVAGTVSAFLMVIMFFSFAPPHIFNYTPIPMYGVFLIALVASGIFFVIDLLSKDISDNILNPLLTGAGMTLIFLLFSN